MIKINAPVYFLIAIALFAQAPTAPQSTPPDPSKTGTVQGKVVDAIGGQSLTRVSVSLELLGSRKVYSASTDADGQFRFLNLQPGNYLLNGEREGYPIQVFPKNGNYGQPDPIRVEAGKDVTGLDFKLVRQ